MTNPHDPEHASPSGAADQTTPLPPFVFVPEGDQTQTAPVPPIDGQIPIWHESPDAVPLVDQEPAPARRWSRGHTVAAAVVAVGALVAGGVAVAARDSGSTPTAASSQQPVGPNGSQQLPPSPGQGQRPGQDPLANLGQLDVGQLDGLLNQLSNGKLDSDQLRALLALLGLPDHVDASQLPDLLQQLGGGHLLDRAGGDGSSGAET